MVARLVAVSVLADHARAEYRQLLVGARHVGEHAVQLLGEALLAAHQGDETVHVLRHVPEILPTVTLADILGIIVGAEVGGELALLVPRLDERGSRVVQVPVVPGALVELLGDVRLPQSLRHAGDAIIVVSVLQRLRHRPALPLLRVAIRRHVSQALIIANALIILPVGGSHARLQRLLRVEVADALQVSIHDHRHGVIAYHHVRLPAIEVPQGQRPALLVEVEEALHHIVHALRIDVGKQRVVRPEGVPQREGGVVRPAVRLVHLVVRPEVRAVHVAVNRGGYLRVVHRRVELHQIILAGALHLDPRQALVPARRGARAVQIEIVRRRLGA